VAARCTTRLWCAAQLGNMDWLSGQIVCLGRTMDQALTGLGFGLSRLGLGFSKRIFRLYVFTLGWVELGFGSDLDCISKQCHA
jgi:hypothetical protein